MEIIIAILLFGLLMAAITFYGYRRYARPGRVFERLGAPVLEAEVLTGATLTQTPEVGWIVRVIQQVGEKVPISPDDAGATRRDLIMAGYRSETAIKVLNGIKITLCILLVVMAFSFRSAMPNPVLKVVLIAFSGFMGFYLPGYMLDKKITKRQNTIRLALPDALDMLVVSVEAGLGLDQALQHVGRELHLSHPELSEELSLVNLEMRAGKPRAEALRNLVSRTGVDDIKSLVGTLVQTDRFGTSISQALRVHSDSLRTERRQRAEEQAAKTTIKMVPPLVLFVLPSIIIVSLGPALIELYRTVSGK
jgi:tight adherence protein C